MDTVKSKIEKELERQLDRISELEPGTDAMDKAIKNVSDLHKLRVEEDKATVTFAGDIESRAIEREKLEVERKKARTTLIASVLSTAATVGMFAVGMTNNNIWLARGFKFEETGIYTSKVFDNIWKAAFNRK